MHIVSWNVNGLPTTLKDAISRYGSLTAFFRDILRADIVCFQEAKVQEEKLERWMACVPEYESFWAFSTAKKGYSGVSTYVRDTLSPLHAAADPLEEEDESEAGICEEGRVMVTDHGRFSLVNVYAPNSGERPERGRLGFKLAFLRALRRKCDAIVSSGQHVVLVGDLNISHKDADVFQQWRVSDIYCPEELEWLDSLFGKGGYVDLFRHFRPDALNVFSVWDQRTDARSRNEGQRIDYTICNKAFLGEVISADILKISPKKWSDHAAVNIVLKDQPPLHPHPPAPLSSKLMRRFQEDSRQRKLTALFQRPMKTIRAAQEGSGKVRVADTEAREVNGMDGNAESDPDRWQPGGSRISGPVMIANKKLPAGIMAGCSTGQVSKGERSVGSEIRGKDSACGIGLGEGGRGGVGKGVKENNVDSEGSQRCFLATSISVEGGDGGGDCGGGEEDVGGVVGGAVGANADGRDVGKVGGEEMWEERADNGVHEKCFRPTSKSEELVPEFSSVLSRNCETEDLSGTLPGRKTESSLEVGVASSLKGKAVRKVEQQQLLGRKKSRGGKLSDSRQRPISIFMTKPA